MAAIRVSTRCSSSAPSLMIHSGYRFASPQPTRSSIAAINLGRTRADDLLALRSAIAARWRCGVDDTVSESDKHLPTDRY